MEKRYEVTMGIRQKSAIRLEWEKQSFKVFGRAPEEAKTSALLKAAKAFPLDAWDYDHANATVEEISLEQTERELEERRNQILAEQPEKLQKVRDDLAKEGIFLPE